MDNTNTEISNQTETVNNDMQATLDDLSQSVGQLQADVSTLLSHTVEAGKSGMGMLRSQARQAVDGLRDRVADWKNAGTESLHDVEHRIERKPISSVLIAVGIGFILASILHRR